MSREYIRQEYIKGTPLKEIADTLGISKAAVRNRALRDPGCPTHGSLLQNDIIPLDTSSLKGDSIMSREPTQAELNAFKAHCVAHDLPYDKWRAFWHKTKEYSALFANKEAEEAQRNDQEEFLKRLQKAAPRIRKSPVPTKTLAIPANFDVHIGKHCELIRTGNDYTPDKAVKQVLEGTQALWQLTKPFGVTDILIPLGNDIVHVDNNRNTSTSGTPQDSYGSIESQMFLATELYIRMIEDFATNHNVWLCHVHSNHDRVSGWSVSQMVARYFVGHPRVHAAADSMSQQHRKYFVFGDNLIMFHHGEAKEEKLLGIIKKEANLGLAQTNRVYCYQGHTHHKQVSKRGLNTEVDVEKDHSALTVVKSGSGAVNQLHVETVRSPSPSDQWHSEKIFANMPAIEMFIHSEHSQFARFTHYF
jgi:hypothetical protein